MAHVVAIAILAFLAWSIAVQAADAEALGLTSTNAAALAWLLYTLLQAGRVVHEGGHALVGIAAGRQLTSVRLTPLLMVADFPDGELEHGPVRSRRLVAVAGSAIQAVFGFGLLATVTASGERWLPIVRETVFLCGVLHVAALANLLPLPQTDGHLLFGRAWRTRPAWLGLLPVVLVMYAVPLVLTALGFPHGYTRAYVAWLGTPDGYVRLAVAALLTLLLTRRLLFPSAAASHSGPQE